jgi:hypothetical protein
MRLELMLQQLEFVERNVFAVVFVELLKQNLNQVYPRISSIRDDQFIFLLEYSPPVKQKMILQISQNKRQWFFPS